MFLGVCCLHAVGCVSLCDVRCLLLVAHNVLCDWCLLIAVCCVGVRRWLRVAWCSLLVVCCLLFVCGLFVVVSRLLFVVRCCCLLCAVCCCCSLFVVVCSLVGVRC